MKIKPLLLSFSLACGAAVCADPVTLVKDGKSEAVIVLPEKATTAVQLAALEVQDAVRNITGVELPVVKKSDPAKINLQFGDTPDALSKGIKSSTFGEQEYTIRFEGKSIFLNGRDAEDFRKVVCDYSGSGKYRNLPDFWKERGPLNAAYYLIERYFGVRFLNQTAWGTYYPKNKTLSVEAKNIRRKPFMHYREISGALERRPENLDHALYLLKTGKEWVAAAYPNQKDRKRRCALFLLRRNYGGTKVKANHSMLDYYQYFLHKNAKKHIAFHPEYFAKGYKSTPQQLCSTNPELIRVVAKEAHNYFAGKDILGNRQKPPYKWGRHNFAIVPDDNGLQCRCPECRKLWDSGKTDNHGKHSSSELIFNFVNRIAEQIRKTDPGETVSCLAYAEYEYPPSFELCGNIAVHYCWSTNRQPAWRRDYQGSKKHFQMWTKRPPKQGLYLWLYNTFPYERAAKNNWNCFPGFFARQAGKQYKLFQKHQVKGVFHCGWGQEVENYLGFRMMDDPDLDPEQLIREYFTLQFGPAAKPMQAFYDTAESYYLSKDNTADTLAIHWGKVGTPERMKVLADFLDQAEKAAAASPYRERVALWRNGIWRYMKEGADSYKLRSSQPIPKFTIPRVAEAKGNPEKADFSKAKTIDTWYLINSGKPALRKHTARFMHDGTFLYGELTDCCDTGKLEVSAGVFPCDCWEVFVSSIRGGNYRQYAMGPTGLMILMAHGEVNFRKNVKLDLPDGAVSRRIKSAGNIWIQRFAIPLKKMLPNPCGPGSTFYMNILRSAGENITGQKYWTQYISSMISYTILHDPYRLAEVTLEK